MDRIAIATRRVDEQERADAEQRAVTLKVVRGHIQDMAIELQFLGLGHRTTIPETVEFQDRILRAYSDFIEAAKDRGAARNYVTPACQIASATEVSQAMQPGAAAEIDRDGVRMLTGGGK